jgi:hypothetical protein
MAFDPSRFPQSGDLLTPSGTTFGSSGSLEVPARPTEVGTPEWWLARLIARLAARAATCSEFHDFYEGRQPLAFASSKFVEVYGLRFGRFPANFMPLVVDAEKDRLIVEGFRFANRPQGGQGRRGGSGRTTSSTPRA